MSDSTPARLPEGVVLVSHSGHCRVRLDDGTELDCRLRGRLKQGPKASRTVAVAGDRVRVDRTPEGTGVVEEVLPRRNKISRMSSKRDRGRIEQVLMANLDQVVVVQSVRQPDPVAGFVDRLLVAAERYDVRGLLCLNKADLDPAAAADPRWDHYAALGYQVLRTSAATGAGVQAFHDALTGRTSLLLGASGTGKSSLLAAATGLELRVGEVTEKTGLGRHTTTRTDLFPLADGGFIADSPGIRGFDAWDLEPQALRDQFPEFREPALRCRFSTCLHREEPDCGVRAALTLGAIPRWRYEAYLGMLKDLETAPGARTGGGQRRRRP
ncbi:MAG TPA: ribosome small subunit-dependent GTPase A [Candidatus Krumholzibacteria bacterium]|nr:ribosome small subunit-dependent GTPase A [Candidatus Krumholzibacteria bacterium]HRX52375.1 ribosome small subunit-dependent GTPase A [Candidatus Krumholzibacteria bacterium]